MVVVMTAEAGETEVDGVVDVFNGIVVSGPAVTFRIDPQRAAIRRRMAPYWNRLR